MVKMTNIQMDGVVVSLHCIPENREEESFDFSFRLDTREIVKTTKNDTWYAGHAITALRKEWNQTGKLPETMASYWC